MQLNLFFSVEEQLEISITGKAKVYIAGFYKGENINRIRILSAALDSDGRLKEAIPKPTSERIPQKVINLKEASYEKDKTTVRRFEAKPNVQELRSQRTSSSLYDDYES